MHQILIVDDEPHIIKSLQRLLEDDYAVTVALGAQAALDLLLAQHLKCDAILCDLSMPNISGADFYYAVSKNYPGLEKRIIFMTGGAYTEEMRQFIFNVDNVYLEKPFERDALYFSIQKILSL